MDPELPRASDAARSRFSPLLTLSQQMGSGAGPGGATGVFMVPGLRKWLHHLPASFDLSGNGREEIGVQPWVALRQRRQRIVA